MFWIFLVAVILAVLFGDFFWIICLITAAAIVIYLISKYVNNKQEEAHIAERLTEENCRKNDHSVSNADRVNSFSRYGITSAPAVWQGCPLIYKYPNLSIRNVNRDLLWSIVKQKDFELQPVKDDSGAVLLKWHGTTAAKLNEKADICADWLDKQLPIRCEFVEFAAGKEKVALFFYKDQESTLQASKCEIVKLTSCLSSTKQETISFLEEGEKLFVEWDDNDKPYLRDISGNPVGSLPVKFTEYCENDLIDGIFFDHTEIKKSEDFEKEDKLIPFVRVYTSEE